MIPLRLEVSAEGDAPFVTRLTRRATAADADSILLEGDGAPAFAGSAGLFTFESLPPEGFDGDVLLIDPVRGTGQRLIRAGSRHNSLLVTEQCDQLCLMCSQPPKKSHSDRFALLEQACLLAPPDSAIGISGGEPTLYKAQLFDLIERTVAARPDIQFHVLSNGQHFGKGDVERLRRPAFANVTWGIPLYAPGAELHDDVVGKVGAFDRLFQSFGVLLQAGSQIELRTVLLQANAPVLGELAVLISHRLRFVHVWSIMQLENIGFARRRWSSLYFDHANDFGPVRAAIDRMQVGGLAVRLFNFPRCSVPAAYRAFATASISDWKRKYPEGCAGCREQAACTGFFEWHPNEHANAQVTPL